MKTTDFLSGPGLTLAGVLVPMIIAAGFLALRRPHRDPTFPYQKKDALFSAAERSFLGILAQAAGNDYQIFGKVRVADVISVTNVSDRKSYLRAFNKISAKHFDYILCTKGDMAIVCAVELDDKSHQNANRQSRDVFLEQVCKAASLPLLRVPARRTYVVTDVRDELTRLLGRPDSVPPVGLSTDEPAEGSSEIQKKFILEPTEPVCPKCTLPMARRRFRSGPNAGKEFWGCTGFPKCRSTTDIEVHPVV